MPSGGRNKLNIDQARAIFKKFGWTLLATEYHTNNTPMEALCKCKERVFVRLSKVQTGTYCQKCKGKAAQERLKVTDETIAALCKKHGHTFIKSWIEKKKTRLEYECKCGNVATAIWSNFARYPNCWECGKLKKSGDKCYMYDPDREAVAMRKKFRKICGQHIHRFMKATKQKKTKHTHELLGYKPIDLQEHILNHPNMKNCDGKEWHVDHIWPIQAFLDHGILDLKVINSLGNLRPVPGPENLSKADKYDEKEFVKWLAKATGSK